MDSEVNVRKNEEPEMSESRNIAVDNRCRWT